MFSLGENSSKHDGKTHLYRDAILYRMRMQYSEVCASMLYSTRPQYSGVCTPNAVQNGGSTLANVQS